MAYARFGPDSDVYLYRSVNGFDCCGCRLEDRAGGWHTMESVEDALSHVQEHIDVGHKFPQRALDRLKEEQNER